MKKLSTRRINDAVKKLPSNCRKPFKDLWEATGLMDLYDGDLKLYINVVRQHLEWKKYMLSEVTSMLELISKVVGKNESK